VSLVTCYGQDDRGNLNSIPDGRKDFTLLRSVQTGSGFRSASYLIHLCVFFLETERPRLEADL